MMDMRDDDPLDILLGSVTIHIEFQIIAQEHFSLTISSNAYKTLFGESSMVLVSFVGVVRKLSCFFF